MKEIVERLLAGGLEELAGLTLEGTIPLRQELINTALAEALQVESGPSAPAGGGAPAPPPALDLSALARHVKRAEVEAQGGILTLRFAIRIDPPTRP